MADLDQPLRIALVLTASTGGIGRHVASVATRLTDRGHRVRIFCPESTDRAQGFGDLGLEVLPLASLRRAAGAQVVHAHGFKAGGLCLAVTRAPRTPLVVTWHNAVLGRGAECRRRPAAAARRGPEGRSDPRREQ